MNDMPLILVVIQTLDRGMATAKSLRVSGTGLVGLERVCRVLKKAQREILSCNVSRNVLLGLSRSREQMTG